MSNKARKKTEKQTQLKCKDLNAMSEMSILSINNLLAKFIGHKKATIVSKAFIILVLTFMLICTLTQLGVKTLISVKEYQDKLNEEQKTIELTDREISISEREKAVAVRENAISAREEAVAKREKAIFEKEATFSNNENVKKDE